MAVYAFSDLHGNLAAYDALMAHTGPEDRLYFLGDSIDRGKHGMEIMLSLLADRRVTCLMGNHEKMMYEAVRSGRKSYDFELWRYNGGYCTFLGLEEAVPSKTEQRALCDTLAALPTYARYASPDGTVWHLSHSGYESGPVPTDTDRLLWNRDHFETVSDCADNEIQVHGHTSTFHLMYFVQSLGGEKQDTYDGRAIWYDNGHKVDIDCLTAYTGRAIMLNLDTKEEIVADAEPEICEDLSDLPGYLSFERSRKTGRRV